MTKKVDANIIVRRGSATQWAQKNTVLASGEFGLDETNNILKIGDGTTAWGSLPVIPMGSASPESIIVDITKNTSGYMFSNSDDFTTILNNTDPKKYVLRETTVNGSNNYYSYYNVLGTTWERKVFAVGGTGGNSILVFESATGYATRYELSKITEVVANPSGSGSTDLTKLQVGGTIYNIPSGGGGSGGTEVEALTNAQFFGMELSGMSIDGRDYNVFSSYNVNYDPGLLPPAAREEELTSITCGALETPTGRFTITQFYRHNITLVVMDDVELWEGVASFVALFNLVTTSPEPFTTLEEVVMEIYAQTDGGQGYISATGSMQSNWDEEPRFINYLQAPQEDGGIKAGQLSIQVSDGSFTIVDDANFMEGTVLRKISDIVQRT